MEFWEGVWKKCWKKTVFNSVSLRTVTELENSSNYKVSEWYKITEPV